MNNLLSTGQLAKFLGVSLSTIYRYLKANKISDIGSDWKFNSFNHLWKALKTEYNSVQALTELICERSKPPILVKRDNRYSFPSNVRDGIADTLPF